MPQDAAVPRYHLGQADGIFIEENNEFSLIENKT
jgi:hypothetical protein